MVIKILKSRYEQFSILVDENIDIYAYIESNNIPYLMTRVISQGAMLKRQLSHFNDRMDYTCELTLSSQKLLFQTIYDSYTQEQIDKINQLMVMVNI